MPLSMVLKLIRVVALVFVLSSCVLAVEDPQAGFEQSLRERDRFFDAAVMDNLVTIKATDEVWSFVLDQGGFSTAQSASADLLYHYLLETALIVPYVAESLRIADLSKVKRERSRSRKQKTLTPSAQKMLNDWKGRISYEIIMDFVPELDKMDVAAENLDKALSVTMAFAPPTTKAFFVIKVDPEAEVATTSQSDAGARWTLTVPAYKPIKRSDLVLPRR